MANENEWSFITCHYEFCKEKPQILCHCKPGGIVLCQNHLAEHRSTESVNIHNTEPLYVIPNTATKDLLAQFLDMKVLHFCEMKKNQLEKSKALLSELIKDQNIYVQECDQKILKLLQMKEKICSTQKISKIYQSRIEEFLSAPPDSSIEDIERWYDTEFSNNTESDLSSNNQFSITIKRNKEVLALQTFQNIFDMEKFVTPELLNLLYCKTLIADILKFKDVASLEHSYYNRDLISNKYEMSSLLKKFLTDKTKEILFNIVNFSKGHKSIATAASNSITILNWIGFSFLNIDFRGINIPFADLSNTSLINIDFEGSDLQWVDFSRSNCYWINFKNCVLDNAKFSMHMKRSVDFSNYSKDYTCVVQFSPDEKALAYIDEYLRPILFDMNTEKYTILSKELVSTVCFSPDGEYIAYGGTNKIVYVWEISTEEIEYSLKAHKGNVYSVSFSPCGSYLASGSGDQTVILWDYKQSRHIKTLKKHTASVSSVCFSRNGRHLASGSWDKRIIVWNIINGTAEKCFLNDSFITSVDFSSTEDWIAFGDEKLVQVWDIVKDVCIKKLSEHENIINSVSFSPCGKFLASVSDDCSCKLWDVYKNKKINEFVGQKAVAFSKYGNLLATGYHSAIYIWNFDPNLRYTECYGHKEPVYSISLSSSNRYLASAGEGETIKIWDIQNLKLLSEHKIHEGFVSSICFSPNDELLLSGGGADKVVKLYDIKNRSVIRKFIGHREYPRSVEFVPFGKYIASVGNDNCAIIWEIEAQKIFKKFENVYDIAFHPNLNVFVLSCKHEIRIISIDNWEEKRILTINYPYKYVIFSPLGNILATISFENEISLWNTTNFSESNIFLDGNILAFSPCEGYLAVADNANILLYDINSLEFIEFKGHIEEITSISYSSDGKFICSGSQDKTIKIWDAEKGLESLTQKIKGLAVYSQSFLMQTTTSEDLIMFFCSFSKEKLNPQTLKLVNSLGVNH